MSALVLCTEPTSTIACKPKFRLAASGWIDPDNYGGSNAARVPSGVRLRWNVPSLRQDPPVYPSRFHVMRSKAPLTVPIFAPEPKVGRKPRVFAPEMFWVDARSLSGTNDAYLLNDGDDTCNGAAAVYFELDAGASSVMVSLHNVVGKLLASAMVSGGDSFYAEFPELGAIHFSDTPGLTRRPKRLVLPFFYEVPMELIGDLDARAYLTSTLDEVGLRYATAGGTPFNSLDDASWEQVVLSGRAVAASIDAGSPAPEKSLQGIEAAAGLSWEVAALIGWGFLDGEHPADPPPFDKLAGMLPAPSNDVYAYQIVAIDNSGKELDRSSFFFARVSSLDVLQEPSARLASEPTVRLQIVNVVDKGPTDDSPIIHPVPQDEEAYVDSAYNFLHSTAADTVEVTPFAGPSEITGDTFTPFDRYVFADAAGPVQFEKLEAKREIKLDYSVPYVDSAVWVEACAADQWDRRSTTLKTPEVSPEFKYSDDCLPPVKASYVPPGQVTVEFEDDGKWRADRITAFSKSKGTIDVKMKHPDVDAAIVAVRIGPAFVHEGSVWATNVSGWNDVSLEQRLIGGSLMVADLNFKIVGFAHRGADVSCLFEVPAACASGMIYSLDSDGRVAATLREAEDSPFLWVPAGSLDIRSDGSPAAYACNIDLLAVARQNQIDLSFSRALFFAARLSIFWGGSRLEGPQSHSVPLAYIAAKPDVPTVNLAVSQIGVDYYDRAIVRAKADASKYFDRGLNVKVSFMNGEIPKDKEDDFSTACTAGLFGPQEPFLRQTVFQAFTGLSSISDGAPTTLGVSAVRPQDGMDSEYLLRLFFARSPGS